MRHIHEQEINSRLKTILGHVKKVQAMAEDNAYCIDILNQSKAIQQALRKVDELLLDRHLRSCAIKHMKQGKTDLATKEILSVFKRL
jgi:DNA-binding FrmR family transcriptional regulator